MKCSVFIATSLDGFIARENGEVDWLHTSGNINVDLGDQSDMGMNAFMSTVDCMIMGRKCMDMISSMNLSADQWPYGDIKIVALSNTITKPPDNLKNKVEMYSGDILALISKLENAHFKHAYIDGGATIQAFLDLELINEMTITKAPIILGTGIPLFGKTIKDIKLEAAEAEAFPNDFVQIKYKVSY